MKILRIVKGKERKVYSSLTFKKTLISEPSRVTFAAVERLVLV